MPISRVAAFTSAGFWRPVRAARRNARGYVCATSPTVAPSNIRLLACDMDGTILNSKSTITPENIAAVERLLKETDVTFVPCTGKTRAGAIRSMGKLGERLSHQIHPKGVPGVYSQGLVVYGRDGHIVYETGVESTLALRITELADALDLSLIAYSRDSILCSREDYFTDLLPTYHEPAVTTIGDWRSAISSSQVLNKFIFLAEPARIDKIRATVETELGDRAHCTQAQSNMLEVLPPNTSKGNGLKQLLKAWDIGAEDVLAIGDAENDIEMLKFCGLSCAVGNALDSVKKVSKIVDLPTNDESGVSSAIHRFLLVQ